MNCRPSVYWHCWSKPEPDGWSGVSQAFVVVKAFIILAVKRRQHRLPTAMRRVMTTSSVILAVLASLVFGAGLDAQENAATTQNRAADRSQYAGTIKGRFDVSNSGSAHYSVPIDVPPGIAGMHPRLVATYSSGSGNGLMGMGWRLEGLSAIQVCPPTMAQDGFRNAVTYTPENDRFCLDGQRLIAVADRHGNQLPLPSDRAKAYGQPGTVYHTELETWTQVSGTTLAGVDGIASFTAKTKSGLLMTYGETADSRILATGTKHVRVWAVSRITDRNGNDMTFSYETDDETGAYRPKRIDYTGHPPSFKITEQSLKALKSERVVPDDVWKKLEGIKDREVTGEEQFFARLKDTIGEEQAVQYKSSIRKHAEQTPKVVPQRSVEFSYEKRPDSIPHYLGGHIIQQTWRLRSITTFVETSPVRTYTFKYEPPERSSTGRSRLHSITESDASGKALPQTIFAWQDGKPGQFYNPFLKATKGATVGGQLYPMDVNGDGSTDLVSVVNSEGAPLEFTAMLGSAVRNATLKPQRPQTPLKVVLGGGELFAMDVNGDGFGDFVYAVAGDNPLTTTIFLGNGSAFTPTETSHPCKSSHEHPCEGTKLLPADVNGDGLSDLIYYINNSSDNLILTVLLSNGSGFQFSSNLRTALPGGGNLITADVNGDGMSDLVYATAAGPLRLHVLLSNAEGFRKAHQVTTVPNGLFTGGLLAPMDANGDGKTDLVYLIENPNSNFKFHLFLSNGLNDYTPPKPGETEVPGGGQAMPMEVNGDGMTDLVYVSTDPGAPIVGQVFISNGHTLVSNGALPSQGAPFGGGTFIPIDANGDSKTDLVYLETGGDNLGIQISFATPQFISPDLATTFTNGLGGVDSVSYKPLTELCADTKTAPSTGKPLTTPCVYTKSAPSTGNPTKRALSVFPSINGARYPASGVTPQTLGAHFPIVTADFPRYVVADYSRGDGRGNHYRHAMFYSHGLFDLNGRGWLGFRTVTRTDEQLGTQLVSTFHQPFPLTNRLQSRIRRCTNATQKAAFTDPKCTPHAQLSETRFGYLSSTHPNTHPFAAVFQVVPQWRRKDFYHYGAYQYSLGKTYTYDRFANRTELANLGYVKKSDLGQPDVNLKTSDDVYTYRLYYNDTANWRLGFRQFEKVSQSSSPPVSEPMSADDRSRVCMTSIGAKPNAATARIMSWTEGEDLRLTCYAYDDVTTMRLSQRQRWDHTNRVSLTSTYGYDPYGNRTHRISPAGHAPGISSPEDYAYVTTYDPSHTFPQSYTRPANNRGIKLTTRYQYDPRFGVRIAQTDPNGHTTKWHPDDLGRLTAQELPDPAGNLVQVMRQQWRSDRDGTYLQTEHRVDWAQDSPFIWRDLDIDGLGRHYRVATASPNHPDGPPIESTTCYQTAKLVQARSYPYFLDDAQYWQALDHD